MQLRRAAIAAGLIFGFVTGTANAATVNVTVDGRSSPWVQGDNPTYMFGDGSGAAPTVIANGFDFTAGGTFTITYVSGLTSAYFNTPPYSDANGDTTYIANGDPGSSGNGFPSQYMDYSSSDIFLNELVGTFADASGHIVGTPFAIGNGPFSVVVPTGGAQELLLGVNDDIFDDNSGSLLVSVSGPTGVSAVPLPASAPMFGAALLALGLGGYGMRRKKMSAAS